MPKIRGPDGVETNYDVWGEGPPLVLIHANPFDNTLWLYQVAHFSTHFRVVSIDVRGYGRSSKPDTRFGIEDLSRDAVQVCDHLGIERAVLAGISVGASIVQQLAVDRPGLAQALILAGTSYHPREVPRSFASERVKGYQTGIGYREVHMRKLVTEEFQRTKLGEYLISMFIERNPTTSAKTIARLFQGYEGWDQSVVTPKLTCPVLVVVGEKDSALKGSRELHQRIPQSEFAVIQGAGHACCMENPSDFDSVVIGFLKRNGLIPAGPTGI